MADEPLSPTTNDTDNPSDNGVDSNVNTDVNTDTQDPDVDSGQAQTDEPGTSDTTPGQSAAPESFFDPSTVPEELKPVYKQMQGAFTKKMQGFSGHQDKIDAYNAFMSDPVGEMTKMAKQYGLNIGPAGGQVNSPDNVGANANAEFNPQTWEEVVSHLEGKIMQKFQGQMAPIIDSVQKISASNIEKSLDEIDPMWRTYEDDMKSTLREHPTLVNNVSKLYKLSVPEEVLTSRAVQSALKKINNTANASQAHGSRGTSKTAPTPKKAESFNDAVSMAREQGRKEGWYK